MSNISTATYYCQINSLFLLHVSFLVLLSWIKKNVHSSNQVISFNPLTADTESLIVLQRLWMLSNPPNKNKTRKKQEMCSMEVDKSHTQ